MTVGSSERGMVRRKVVFWLVILVVLVGGIFFFMQYRDAQAKSPKTAADKFAQYLIDKDAQASYEMLDDDFKASTHPTDWETWVNFIFDAENSSYKNLEELEVHDPDGTYEKGSTPTRYKYEFKLDDITAHTTFVLIKDGETWKISEIGAFDQQ
jgi:hypothetical protein